MQAKTSKTSGAMRQSNNKSKKVIKSKSAVQKRQQAPKMRPVTKPLDCIETYENKGFAGGNGANNKALKATMRYFLRHVKGTGIRSISVPYSLKGLFGEAKNDNTFVTVRRAHIKMLQPATEQKQEGQGLENANAVAMVQNSFRVSRSSVVTQAKNRTTILTPSLAPKWQTIGSWNVDRLLKNNLAGPLVSQTGTDQYVEITCFRVLDADTGLDYGQDLELMIEVEYTLPIPAVTELSVGGASDLDDFEVFPAIKLAKAYTQVDYDRVVKL